jgi:hypothetical protein
LEGKIRKFQRNDKAYFVFHGDVAESVEGIGSRLLHSVTTSLGSEFRMKIKVATVIIANLPLSTCHAALAIRSSASARNFLPLVSVRLSSETLESGAMPF